MTVSTEQHDVSYKGTGVANDHFPIPFPFRHTDALKVETIDSNDVATQKTISTHYDVVQLSSGNVLGTGEATITCILDGSGIPAALNGETITIVSNTGVSKTYQFSNTDITSGTMVGSNVGIRVYEVTTKAGVVTQIQAAINHANGHTATVFGTSILSNVITLTQYSTASYTQNSTIALSSGLDTTTEVSKTDFDSRTNIISNNSQRTEYGWIKYKSATTDVIHIYREETPKQEYDYVNTVNIPEGEFEKSLDRLVDTMPSQTSRDNTDPSMYSAGNRRLSNVGGQSRPDDMLSYENLGRVSSSSSTLSIPSTSGTDVKYLAASGYVPSTPAVAWADKLFPPSTSGVDTSSVLSPVASYGSAPYIEWTLPRWVPSPPGDIFRHVYSYGTADAIEGEGTTKSARWRELREMPPLLTTTADVGKVIRLKSTTYQPNVGYTATQPSYQYESVLEPATEDEATRDLRMVASTDGSLVNSPRMKLISQTAYIRFDKDGGGTRTVTLEGVPFEVDFGDGAGTVSPPADEESDGEGNFNMARFQHPYYPILINNALRNDAGALVMPHMVFLQVYSPTLGSNVYPVFKPYLYRIKHTEFGSSHKHVTVQDASSAAGRLDDDSTSNNHILAFVDMMNCNSYAQAGSASDDFTGDYPGTDLADESVDFDDDWKCLTWSGAHTIQMKMLLVYGDSGEF